MTDYAAYAEAIHAICEGRSFFELNGDPDLLKEVFVGLRFYLLQALLCGVSTCFLMIKYGLFSLKHKLNSSLRLFYSDLISMFG